MLQPLHGAVETFGVGGADHVSHVDLPGAVDVDGVVGAEGVPGVGAALLPAVVSHVRGSEGYAR